MTRVLAQTTALHHAFISDQTRLHRQFLSLHDARLQALSPVRAVLPDHAGPPPAPALTQALAHPEPAVELEEKALRAYSRADLEILASGKISQIFGPQFKEQDGYHRQVRMPEPPLLLVDRVTGIEGEPGSMGLGTIWTETDISPDAWYLHHGRVPPGILIESGQADLLLISWLGVDGLNKGERIYRLLGCELTFHEGGMPGPGDTLRYDIHVDGHAKTGDVRLFFFHYDCRVGDRVVLSVRNGQAGFFSDDELAGSGGVLWSAATDEPKADARLDPPPGCTRRRSFTCEQVDAWVAGDAYACFGDGFELAAPHQRTPSLPSGRMHLIGSVPAFDPAGGPWHRGYLRAEAAVTPDHWFYGGHFKNDPCMPGTLMADAAVQALAFHMAALGFTVARDGWRFEAVPDERYKFICRGQVVPDRPHLLSYEIFVEEVIDGDRPTVYAALLCSSDGFKVFQCRRFGLRLVPDWPLGDRRELLAEVGPLRPLRADSDVRGDYAAMLACAWGAPSEAFGKMYARFDRGRRVPRLPGPPYHCMSRVLAIDGPPGKATIGVTVEAEFDVLPDAWYFTENGCQVMPFSVLMEVLLQPCGWLASYLGFAVTDTGDLAFRNLDGDDAVPTMEVTPQSGTLRTRASLVRFSRVGQMTLVFFRVECSCGDWPVLAMNTSFGFFDAAALAHQVGLPTSDQARAQRDTPCEVALELAERPAELYSGSARIAGGRLRMIDAITGYWPEGGAAGLGRIRGLQRIDPGAWYFKAHFFQDPVQPGSLGVDALLQLLQAWMLLQGLDQGLERPRFEAIALDQPLVWRYRGQVVPTNREVITELEITRVEREPNAVLAVAGGNLWVDGLRIYEVENLAMRLVAEPDERGTRDIVLDPTKQPWLRDHCPTHTTPALPIACVVDYLAQAARALAPDLVVIALEDVGVFRWITIDQRGVRLRVETRQIEQDLVEASLLLVEPASDARPVASGKVRLADRYPPPPPAEPPLTTGELDDRPYDHGALFHGPAFQTMRTLRRDRTGASLELDAAPAGAPDGLVNPALLDGVLQGLPHDRLDLWFDEIGADRLCYPQWIERITFHGPSPSRGTMRGEVRPAGIERRRRQPRFRSQIIAHGEVWAAIEHSEVLVSKGRLADVPHRDLRTFFRDRRYVAGLSLSRLIDGASELADAEVALVDWLPGTLEAAYQVDGERAAITTAIAAKEHVARKVEAHPGTVRLADGEASCASAPLTSFPLRIEHRERTTRVADGGPERLELGPVLAFWRGRMGIAEWPGEQLYMATVRRFLRRATLADPSSLEQIRGRPVMFLGNHQVGIESLLFALVASALNQRPVVTIAKQEHRGTWLGRLLDVCQSYPGVVSDRALMFFDRDDKASMLQLMREVENALAAEGLSLMVHAEGTRSLQCRQPVTQLSGVLLDLAITARLPIVPVRFAGALPVEPAATRLEFPLGCARQDIYLGAPLPAEELAALPLADRKRRVLEAMNTLGPDLMQETPNPPDAAFEAGVAGLMQALAMAAPQATILHALQLDPACQGPLRALVEALLAGAPLAGEELEAAWLRRLGAWFTDG